MRVALLALLAATLSAQSFESASVTRFVPSDDDSKPEPVPGHLIYNNISIRFLVVAAYGIRGDQISGPPWIDGERYDVIAKPPADATKDQVPAMLQNLLADRFKVTVRIEDRPRMAYALVVGTSPSKLEPTELISGGDFKVSKDHLDITGVRMFNFTGLLASLMGRPITDQTGLEGHFNVRLNITLEDLKAASPSVFAAIQEVGLKLEERPTTAKYAVVERNP